MRGKPYAGPSLVSFVSFLFLISAPKTASAQIYESIGIRAQGAKRLEPGQVTFVVMSEAATREPHRLIAATVGVAIPRNRDLYGYLSEHHSFGESEDIAGDYAEELAAEMLATTLGLEFDPDKSWDEKKEVYRLSNQIVRTQNVTQTAVGDKKGLWTTVVAAAVLVG